MHAAEAERRSEPAAARRRHVERHSVGRERLQAPPQALEFGGIDAGAGAAGIDQPSAGIVIGEQQSAEIRPPAFRVGPADHDKLLAVQAFHLEPDAARVGRIGD
jgi:hypothetical protein